MPSISTAGQGSFRAVVDETDSSIEYELEYAGLEGEIAQSLVQATERVTESARRRTVRPGGGARAGSA